MPFLIGLFELDLPPVLSPFPRPLPAPLVEVRPPLLLLPLMVFDGSAEVLHSALDPLALGSWLGLL